MSFYFLIKEFFNPEIDSSTNNEMNVMQSYRIPEHYFLPPGGLLSRPPPDGFPFLLGQPAPWVVP